MYAPRKTRIREFMRWDETTLEMYAPRVTHIKEFMRREETHAFIRPEAHCIYPPRSAHIDRFMRQEELTLENLVAERKPH